MLKATDEEIVEAVMLCSTEKGYATYDEVAEIIGLSPTTLSDRVKTIQDLERFQGKHNGYAMTLLSLPENWPNVHH